jgi:hypothetical protein
MRDFTVDADIPETLEVIFFYPAKHLLQMGDPHSVFTFPE